MRFVFLYKGDEARRVLEMFSELHCVNSAQVGGSTGIYHCTGTIGVVYVTAVIIGQITKPMMHLDLSSLRDFVHVRLVELSIEFNQENIEVVKDLITKLMSNTKPTVVNVL